MAANTAARGYVVAEQRFFFPPGPVRVFENFASRDTLGCPVQRTVVLVQV